MADKDVRVNYILLFLFIKELQSAMQSAIKKEQTLHLGNIDLYHANKEMCAVIL